MMLTKIVTPHSSGETALSAPVRTRYWPA